MKRLFILLLTTVLTGILWFVMTSWEFSPDSYVPQEVLDLSMPFSGKIDIKYLKEIKESNSNPFDFNKPAL